MSILVADFNYSEQVDGDTLEQTDFNFFTDDAYSVPADLSNVSDVNMKVRRGSQKGKLVATLTIGTGIKWISQIQGELRVGDIVDDQVQISWGN